MRAKKGATHVAPFQYQRPSNHPEKPGSGSTNLTPFFKPNNGARRQRSEGGFAEGKEVLAECRSRGDAKTLSLIYCIFIQYEKPSRLRRAGLHQQLHLSDGRFAPAGTGGPCGGTGLFHGRHYRRVHPGRRGAGTGRIAPLRRTRPAHTADSR